MPLCLVICFSSGEKFPSVFYFVNYLLIPNDMNGTQIYTDGLWPTRINAVAFAMVRKATLNNAAFAYLCAKMATPSV